MDSYVKTITLDVNADQNYTIVKAKQGDKINRKIAITLKKDGTNFTPTGVSEIWFRVEKPDKNIAIVKSTDSGNPISVSGNVYTVSLSEQCLTASGKAWCDLALLDSSGNTLSSCAFIMNIIPMPNGNTAESISEWADLQEAIDDAERFADIVAFRTSGNYIQYTVDGQTWTNLVNVGAIGGDLQTQIDELQSEKVPKTRKINDLTLSEDLTLTAEDIEYDGTLSEHMRGSVGEKLSELSESLNTVEDDVTNAETNIEKLKENLASVETGNTASRAYSVGEYVVVGGIQYKVTSAIASGATFTIGTNVQAKNVGEALKEKEYFKKSYGSSIITSTDGKPHSGSDIRLAYNDNSVTFSARILLQNLTAGVRPQITLTSDDFVACPSFTGFGNPVMRGQQGNFSDECYCTHSKGSRTIIIQQNNFVSSSTTLLAGWGVYQITGVSMI